MLIKVKGHFLGHVPDGTKIKMSRLGQTVGTIGVTPFRAYPMSRRKSTPIFRPPTNQMED